MTPPSEVSSGPPAYTLWRESLDHLLDDEDGHKLYEKYMKQEGLDHYRYFV